TRAVGEALDTVKADLLDALRLGLVVHDERAALDRGEVLVGVEAEGDKVAGGSDRTRTRTRADGKRRVLDHPHAMARGEAPERTGIERGDVVRGQEHARARRHGG